jgi:hypothetical protein
MQVMAVAVPQVIVTELMGGVLQPVKFAAPAFAQTRQVVPPPSAVVLRLTLVVAFVCVLSGVDEVKVMVAGATL